MFAWGASSDNAGLRDGMGWDDEAFPHLWRVRAVGKVGQEKGGESRVTETLRSQNTTPGRHILYREEGVFFSFFPLLIWFLEPGNGVKEQGWEAGNLF